MTKADNEREVFREFAAAAGLEVEPDSVQSEHPPHPDISCRIQGALRYFELTQIANQDIADEVGRLLVEARKTGEGGVSRPKVYGDTQTLRATVDRKSKLKYDESAQPLDLVVYYDGVFHPVPELEWVEATFRSLQAQCRGRWNAIWLFDRTTKRVLGE